MNKLFTALGFIFFVSTLSVLHKTTSDAALTKVPMRMVLAPGIILPYGDDVQPDFCLFAYGQTVSQSTYSRLYALYQTQYNTGGEVAGTFRLPDLRGRSLFGDDNMGGVAADRVTNAASGITGTTLGATGGSQLLHTHTHVQDSHLHSGTTDTVLNYRVYVRDNDTGGGWDVFYHNDNAEGSATHAHTFTTGGTVGVNQNAGTGSSQNMPPAMIVNWCITI